MGLLASSLDYDLVAYNLPGILGRKPPLSLGLLRFCLLFMILPFEKAISVGDDPSISYFSTAGITFLQKPETLCPTRP